MRYRNSQTMLRPQVALSVLIAAVVLMAAPAASFARAVTGKFHEEFPTETSTLTDFPCAEGLPVVMTATLTRDGHFTDAGRHLSFHGTNTLDYTVEFGDGRHAAGQVIDHFSFVIDFKSPRTRVNSAQQERAILFAANGQPIATIRVHVSHHLTFSDLNNNFEPDPGEITSEVDNSKVTCP